MPKHPAVDAWNASPDFGWWDVLISVLGGLALVVLFFLGQWRAS